MSIEKNNEKDDFLDDLRTRIDNVNTVNDAYDLYSEIWYIYYENLKKYGVDDKKVLQLDKLQSTAFSKFSYLKIYEEKGENFIKLIKSDLKVYLEGKEAELKQIKSDIGLKEFLLEVNSVKHVVEYFSKYKEEWGQECNEINVCTLIEDAKKKREKLYEEEKAKSGKEDTISEGEVVAKDEIKESKEHNNEVNSRFRTVVIEEDHDEEYEDEREDDYEKKKTFLDKLREYITTDWQLTMTREASRQKRVNKVAQNAKDGMEDYLNEQAKRYGVRKESYQRIYQEFDETIEQAKEKYINRRNEILKEQGEYEQIEINAKKDIYNKKNDRKKYAKSSEYKEIMARTKALLREINTAAKTGDKEKIEELHIKLQEVQDENKLHQYDIDIKELNEKINIARENIKVSERNLEKLEEEYESAILNANNDRGKSLANVEKQSLFGKFIGAVNSIAKKIGNKEGKFQKNVASPIRESLGKMKDGMKNFGNGMVDAGQKTVGVIKSIPEGVGKGVKEISTFFRNTKQAVVDKAEKALDSGIEKKQKELDKYKEDNEVEQGHE